MRRRFVLRTIRTKFHEFRFAPAFLFALCFLFGGLLAWVYSGICDEFERTALSNYLIDYCLLFEQGLVSISFRECFWLYFGSFLICFLCGFSPLGVCFIPLMSCILGFASFYTVFCFSAVFGRSGIYLAAALTALRLAFTLPCFFLTANSAWFYSRQLSCILSGEKKRAEVVRFSFGYFLLFVFCVLVLSAGIVLEHFLTPILFRGAINRI